ncbi:MAG: hypothetical protein ACRDVZ_03095, partial [Jiangellaceae bacterium]
EWMLSFVAEEAQRPGLSQFTDGVVRDVDVELDDWDAGRFRLLGKVLRLEWLAGAEADAAWPTFGWG